MSLSYRPAARRDLEGIVALYNATVATRQATADLQPVTVESRCAWFEAHVGRYPLWVVDLDGGIGAWLSFSPFHERPAYAGTAELGVYVGERCRRRGLASFLLAEAIAQAPRLGLRRLVGLIFGHNEPSLRLFARFGFEHWGRLPGVAELDGIERDLVIVGRRVR